jgi:hypothetical protein
VAPNGWTNSASTDLSRFETGARTRRATSRFVIRATDSQGNEEKNTQVSSVLVP